MTTARRLSTRLMVANLIVLGVGGLTFAVTFRLLASEIFNRRLHNGPGSFGGGPGGPNAGGQGLLEAFRDSVDIALLVSAGVGLIAAGLVAWFVASRLAKPINGIRETTRAIAAGDYGRRIGEGEIVELDALAHDVNRLAHDLEATEQARARLLSEVTHELRTPLATIDGFVEGVMDGVFTVDEMYVAVTDETSRLLHLVEDLSLLSKTTEHSLVLETEPLVLSDVASATIERLRPQYTERQVAITLTINDDPAVVGDESRLRQVVSNLLVNALGHVPRGGNVAVTVAAEAGFGSVAVLDDGDGIDADSLARVFDRFFRGPNAQTRSGSGLGLAVAKGIAEAHGGTLVAASDGPGQGASFVLTVPVAPNDMT